MIEVRIEIDTVPTGGNEFGVGVKVIGNVDPRSVPEGEGATLIGIGIAINAYMESRGALNFNCLRGLVSDEMLDAARREEGK